MNKETKHINRPLSDWWSHMTVHITLDILPPPPPPHNTVHITLDTLSPPTTPQFTSHWIHYPHPPPHSSHHTGYITPTHHPTVYITLDTLPPPTTPQFTSHWIHYPPPPITQFTSHWIHYPHPPPHSSHHTGYITPTHHPTVHITLDTLPPPTTPQFTSHWIHYPPPDQKARTDTHWTWRMQPRRGRCAGRGRWADSAEHGQRDWPERWQSWASHAPHAGQPAVGTAHTITKQNMHTNFAPPPPPPPRHGKRFALSAQQARV